ncbi:Cys-rich peptide radical SAM maturase CcpM [Halodesulfovibrio aestuarii]|uniref:Cys-rich peptide radical SAM maturase CcpM n=1 Tax=Halodesulfovibrio aestuarii TaxID=126333 RepID=A0ABV4JNI7_9BACT
MQNLSKALVHPFRTPRNYYLFDGNKNAVLKVPKSIHALFEKKTKIQLSNEDTLFLKKLYGEGYLHPSPVCQIEHQYEQILNEILCRRVEGITLQVTQQCNLRCKYCIYSGSYKSREHSGKKMSFEMAKKGVDFVLQRSVDIPTVAINFYGGEPLLAFDLMKKVVEYAKKRAEGKKIVFNVTTNGTLFTDENIRFLSENAFSVMISLDGSKEVHDKNRVFAASGKGTFDAIMHNLQHIKTYFPEFYTRIIFNAVIDPTLGKACTNNFFITSKELEGAQVTASLVSVQYKKDEIAIPDSFFIDEEIGKFKLLLHKLQRVDGKYISAIMAEKFQQIQTRMYLIRQHYLSLPAKCHPGGPCVPGATRLFLNVDGEFYPCERVSETSKNTCIGHINTGFDMPQVSKILNIARLTENACKKCWAFIHCYQCVAVADDIDSLSKQKRLEECSSVKYLTHEILRDYCTLLEHGYVFENEKTTLQAWG